MIPSGCVCSGFIIFALFWCIFMHFAYIHVFVVKLLVEFWAPLHVSTSQHLPLGSQSLHFELVFTLTQCQLFDQELHKQPNWICFSPNADPEVCDIKSKRCITAAFLHAATNTICLRPQACSIFSENAAFLGIFPRWEMFPYIWFL